MTIFSFSKFDLTTESPIDYVKITSFRALAKDSSLSDLDTNYEFHYPDIKSIADTMGDKKIFDD